MPTCPWLCILLQFLPEWIQTNPCLTFHPVLQAIAQVQWHGVIFERNSVMLVEALRSCKKIWSRANKQERNKSKQKKSEIDEIRPTLEKQQNNSSISKISSIGAQINLNNLKHARNNKTLGHLDCFHKVYYLPPAEKWLLNLCLRERRGVAQCVERACAVGKRENHSFHSISL